MPEKDKTARDFPTAAVLSLYTGVMLCNFSEMQELAEYLVGTSVWTHQFAHKPFVDEMSEALAQQHPALKAVDASHVDRDNWAVFALEQVGVFGTRMRVHPMGEPEHYAEGFTEPLKLIGTAVQRA